MDRIGRYEKLKQPDGRMPHGASRSTMWTGSNLKQVQEAVSAARAERGE